jgi:hypothetical protein
MTTRISTRRRRHGNYFARLNMLVEDQQGLQWMALPLGSR